jgi:hypothetical protein
MINLLLRLYPARWRARYGDEFELVLSDRPLGPFDVADVLLGALDAHLHLRGLGAASQHGRGFAMTLRIGGYSAIIGGLLWFTVLVGNAINDGAETISWWIGIALVVATIATLIALIGLSAFQARRYPALTWAAVAIPAAGGFVALLGVVAITVNGDSDRGIIGDLSGWAIATLGLLAMLAGSGLFALATWRTRSLSRGAAALLALGALIVVPALGGLTGGLVPSALVPLAIFASVLLFPAGWVALGISALRTDRAGIPLEGALP